MRGPTQNMLPREAPGARLTPRQTEEFSNQISVYRQGRRGENTRLSEGPEVQGFSTGESVQENVPGDSKKWHRSQN